MMVNIMINQLMFAGRSGMLDIQLSTEVKYIAPYIEVFTCTLKSKFFWKQWFEASFENSDLKQVFVQKYF